MTLDEILKLVGPLDDSADENAAKDRFRTHLTKSVTTPGALRDHTSGSALDRHRFAAFAPSLSRY